MVLLLFVMKYLMTSFLTIYSYKLSIKGETKSFGYLSNSGVFEPILSIINLKSQTISNNFQTIV